MDAYPKQWTHSVNFGVGIDPKFDEKLQHRHLTGSYCTVDQPSVQQIRPFFLSPPLKKDPEDTLVAREKSPDRRIVWSGPYFFSHAVVQLSTML
ncbi:hypothetical protein N7453_005264 [Penicillium expansum]|nr:hypothetical protein N7453_005264 [Penicillium expansum]